MWGGGPADVVWAPRRSDGGSRMCEVGTRRPGGRRRRWGHGPGSSTDMFKVGTRRVELGFVRRDPLVGTRNVFSSASVTPLQGQKKSGTTDPHLRLWTTQTLGQGPVILKHNRIFKWTLPDPDLSFLSLQSWLQCTGCLSYLNQRIKLVLRVQLSPVTYKRMRRTEELHEGGIRPPSFTLAQPLFLCGPHLIPFWHTPFYISMWSLLHFDT